MSRVLLLVLLSALKVTAIEFTVDPPSPLLGARAGARAELDLGFNDWVDAMISVPPQHRGDLLLRYQCEDGKEQRVSIPDSVLKKDSMPHVYRIDMGAELYWRGTLKSLSVETAAKISVGDGEGIDYFAPEPEAEWVSMKVMQSKHFRIFWGTGLSEGFTEQAAHGTLRNFEEAWQFFVKVMKLKRPYPLADQPGTFRKVNIVTHRSGYESGGGTVSMDPSGLRVDPPSWVILHELMHVFQEVQGGKMAGMWCESHADYAIERWLRFARPLFDGGEEVREGEPTCFNPSFATMAHWYLAHGRDYYLCWPVWAYLDENPDALPGIGGGAFSSRLWQEIAEEEDIFTCVNRLAKVDVPALIGHYSRRNVTWNYANGAAMRRVFAQYLRDEPRSRSLIYAELIARPDAPGWWHPPQHQAPQPGGYSQHELKLPKDGRMSVTVRPLNGAIRASLVAIRQDGSEAGFAGPFTSGEQAFTLPRDAKRLVLVVAATPEKMTFWTEDELRFPMRTHPSRQRHHYVVGLTGTEPLATKPEPPSGKPHPNGGGIVAETASVARSVYVGPNASVLDEAKVTGEVIIDGYARVRGNAVISGFARILDDADIENAVIKDHATVSGQSHVWRDDECEITGDAVLTADYGGGRAVSNGFQSGFVGWVGCPQEWIDARHAPPHRWVNYEFTEPHENVITDSPGLTDAFVIGKPTWLKSDAERTGVIAFDGKSQGLLLDANVMKLRRATIAVRLKWQGGAAMQPVWSFTNGDDTLMLTPADGSQRLSLLARCHGKTVGLSSKAALPVNTWLHLSVTMDGQKASISLDDKVVAEGPFEAQPHAFAGNASFLAWNSHVAFHGLMDDFCVWTTMIPR